MDVPGYLRYLSKSVSELTLDNQKKLQASVEVFLEDDNYNIHDLSESVELCGLLNINAFERSKIIDNIIGF